MDIRISHCSTSIENYYLCLQAGVAGFTNRGPKPGDLVYLAVKVGKKSLCGARFVLDHPTDRKPWADADSYVNALTIKDIEFCTPFDLGMLATLGGAYWAVKYVQNSKPIKDAPIAGLLEETFQKLRQPQLVPLDAETLPPVPTAVPEQPAADAVDDDDDLTIESEEDYEKMIEEVPEAKTAIMATFQTVHFTNETDKIKGLEALVNGNFYELFDEFVVERTVLIPENRSFKTHGPKKDGNNVSGIRTIPDGLLIQFDPDSRHPFLINLIEYECYGQQKQRESDKSTYLNSVIIPQLMRFASAFSIITDEQTRNKTIGKWVDQIIQYINHDEQLTARCISWIRELHPDIKERSIDRELEKMLTEAFHTNLRVLLIIDELSTEQKSTIKNVVSSFKLASGERNVQFAGYVVRLVQKIRMADSSLEYALTVQK